MKKVFLTGVSSGIGKALTKRLIEKNFRVWGVARRRPLLEDLQRDLKSKNFSYTVADITRKDFWNLLINDFKKKKFTPDVVIFNAAIHANDLSDNIDLDMLRRSMEINFFSVMEGVHILTKNYKDKMHFITISSTSAFKGNYYEGIGYAASKSALTIAFESLYQKYMNSKISFTTIFLGPVKTDMIRFVRTPPMTLTTDEVTGYIIDAIESRKPFLYYPRIAFIIISIMRLLPNQLFFKIWTKIQKPYTYKNNSQC